jgi:anti-sigma factor RsiW
MTDRSGAEADLRCIEVAEALSAYLDGAVDEEERRRIDSHLAGCPGCTAAIDQFRTVIELSGRLTAADVASVEPILRDRLAATLRVPRRK